jgi:hypothetical protein
LKLYYNEFAFVIEMKNKLGANDMKRSFLIFCLGIPLLIYACTAKDSGNRSITDETVVLLSKGEIPSKKVKVEFSLEGMDTDGFKDGATYDEIRDWVQEKYGMHVTNLNIAQIKRKNGIIERENYNKPKSEDSRQPETTPEKEKAITEALKHFNMIK